MADKRCLSNDILSSDAFLDLSFSAQALYIHLNMDADDDGFINSPKKIIRMIGAKPKDLESLIQKRFLIYFENEGVAVIKHWWVHNIKRNDRHKATKYTELLNQLETKENGVYTFRALTDNEVVTNGEPTDNQLSTNCQPIDNQMATNCQPNGAESTPKLKENKLNENKLIKEEINKEEKFTPPTLEEVQDYCLKRGNNVNAKRFFDYYSAGEWIDQEGKPVRNWKQKMIANWEKTKPIRDSDKLPTYDNSNNHNVSEEEKQKLLELMGKESNEQDNFNRKLSERS